MRRLEGKVMLVAGAGGIGGGIARRFAAEGAAVVLGDHDLDSAASVVSDIRDSGGTAQAITLDGAEEASFAEAVAVCRDSFGGLDGAHLNFATFVDNDETLSVVDMPLEIYDETIRVNQRGYFLGTRAVVPALLERGGGTLLFTSSIAAYRGSRSWVAYAMAKTAGHALMHHVAERFGERGIRANVIAPGTIVHGRLESEMSQELRNEMMSITLLKSRLGTPEDIAGISTLLMSDEGSYITGQVFCVDAGVTRRS